MIVCINPEKKTSPYYYFHLITNFSFRQRSFYPTAQKIIFTQKKAEIMKRKEAVEEEKYKMIMMMMKKEIIKGH